MTDTMTTTAPERIWLQIDPNGDPNDRSEPCPDPADVELTWCWTQVGGQEVEYVRADLIGGTTGREKCPTGGGTHQQQENALKALAALAERLIALDGMYDWSLEVEKLRLALSHAEGEAVPDNVLDVLDNLIHDNYERSYRGAQNRQDDAELIRCALRRSHPAPQVAVPEGWRHALEEALAMMTSQSMTLERQADAVTGIRDLLAAAPAAPAQPDIMYEPAEPDVIERMRRGHEADLYNEVTNEQVGEMVTLIRQLAIALYKASPCNTLPSDAIDYVNSIKYS